MANNTYETLLRKVFELYQQSNKNQVVIEQKINSLAKQSLDTNLLKSIFIVDDTGEIPIVPENSSNLHNTVPGTLLPQNIAYSYEHNFTLPATLLPFLEFEGRFTPNGNRTVSAAALYNADAWDSNYFEVTGDGSKIWLGVLPPAAPYAKVTQAQIDAGNVSASHTKKAWNCDVYWTETSPSVVNYRMLGGQLVGFTSPAYNTSSGCGGNTNASVLDGSLFFDTDFNLLTATKPGTIDNISGNSMDVHGTETVSTWFNPGTGCANFVTTNSNVSKTLDATTSTLFVLGLRQKQVGATWVYDPDTIFHAGVFGVRIVRNATSFVATPSDFYAYFDTTLRFLFYIFNNTTPGPHLGEPVLGNLPTTVGISPLPFTTIEFKVNPGDYPHTRFSRTGTYAPTYLNSDTYDPMFYRKSKSTDTQEVWGVIFNYQGVVIAPANDNFSPSTYYQWDDTYTQSGATYAINTTSHGTVTRPNYYPTHEDMTARTRVAIRNPLYWKQTSKFDRKET